jgi:hypothetical protein
MTQNFTTNSSAELTFPGGEGQVAAQGTFGGGTIALEFSLDDGTTWTTLEDEPAATLTADGSFGFKSMRTDAASYRLRVTLSSATSPNINVRVGAHL